MNLLTIFRAYKTARKNAANAYGDYRGRGIMVKTDIVARRYQKANRQALKLEQRIERILGGDVYFDDACIICGWRECACTCGHYRTSKLYPPKEK